MPDAKPAPILFFSPFVSSTMRVEPQWIDYNGHMNMAYYHVLFDRTVDEAFLVAGLGPDYVAETGKSFFAAEVHTSYRRELRPDDAVRVTLQLIDTDEKRIYAYLEIRHATESWLSATCEYMLLHVDLATKKVCPFPPEIQENLAVMRAAHGRLPTPPDLGRSIAMRRTEPAPARVAGTRH